MMTGNLRQSCSQPMKPPPMKYRWNCVNACSSSNCSQTTSESGKGGSCLGSPKKKALFARHTQERTSVLPDMPASSNTMTSNNPSSAMRDAKIGDRKMPMCVPAWISHCIFFVFKTKRLKRFTSPHQHCSATSLRMDSFVAEWRNSGRSKRRRQMLSTAVLDGAVTRIRKCFWASSRTTCSKTDVLPVPGGPCTRTTAFRMSRQALTARACWLSSFGKSAVVSSAG